MYKNFNRWLRIVLMVSVTIAAWATAVNQLGQALAVNKALAEKQAIEACIEYDFPRAIVVDGTIYCNAFYYGGDVTIPLEKLKDMPKD